MHGLKRRSVLAAVVCLGVLAGCGDSTADDEEAVADAARTYGVAFLEGNGDEACAVMTETAQSEFAASLSTSLGDLTGEVQDLECPEAIEMASSLVRGSGPGPQEAESSNELEAAADQAIEELDSGEGLGEITIDGDRATVSMIAGLGDGAVELERVDDSWLITSEAA